MTNAALALEISDDTGLPLADVLDMDLEMLMWDYPGAEAEELEETVSASDIGDYQPEPEPEWTAAEILNEPAHEHPFLTWEAMMIYRDDANKEGA